MINSIDRSADIGKKPFLSRAISLFWALTFFVTFGPVIQFFSATTAYAEDYAMKWLFSDGKLTISGDGIMSDFDGQGEWCEKVINYRDKVSCVIEEGVKSIGDNAFWGLSNLSDIAIPDSVTSIGSGAFMFCTQLTSVTLPDTINDIEAEAFAYCTSLKSIVVPRNIKSIGDDAFCGCFDDEEKTSLVVYGYKDSQTFCDYVKANSETDGFEFVLLELESYTVTFPENVTVICESQQLSSGDDVYEGDELKITADVPDGYSLTSMTVNGKSFTSGTTYTVEDSDVDIKAEFEKIIEKRMVTIPEHVIVKNGQKTLSNGASVSEGDVLTITADVPDGYSLRSLTVNGKDFVSGSKYTVGAQDIVIELDMTAIKEIVVTFPDNVTVTRTEIKLHSGDVVKTGDVLWITANTPDGHTLKSLTVNGKEFTSGAKYTVGNENVVIEVELEEIAVIEKYIVTFPENVTVFCSSNQLKSGDSVLAGDKLTITADTPDGYTLKSLAVNGKEFTSGARYTVNNEDIVIEVEFEEIAVIEEYIVTFPENVTVTRSSKQLKSGDAVLTGEKLKITVHTPDGYTLKSLTVNGKEYTSGAKYTVGNENVVIAAEFEEIAVIEEYAVTFPENVTVARSSKQLKSGDTVFTGDKLKITVDVPDGYTLKSLAVNGKEFTNGAKYTVGNENVVIEVKFEEIAAIEEYIVTFPKNVVVTRTEIKLNSGDTVLIGDVLWITADIPEGYSLKALTVNGQNFTNGQAYIVSDKDVVIAVEFSDDTVEVVPISINITSLPYKSTYSLNEQLNLDGCYIDVVFSDGSVENIPVTNDMVSGFDSSMVGTKRVMIVCEGFIVSFEINVESGENTDECVTSDGLIKGWKAVSEIIPEYKEDSITVLLNRDVIVPDYVIQALDAYNVSMTAILNEKIAWTFDANSINDPYYQLDLSLNQFVYVPSYLIKDIDGILTNKIHINFDNEYSGAVSICVGAEYSGRYANLMSYDEEKGKLEFVSSSLISTDGVAQLIPDSSSDYVVIIDTETKLAGDVNNDGKVDAVDAADILRYIVGLIGLDKKMVPDMNEDGVLNAMDAAYILKKQSNEEEDSVVIL